MKNSNLVIQRVGHVEFVMTTFLIEAHKLPFLENYIDPLGIQPLSDKPVNLEETPVVHPQNRNGFWILNQAVVQIMVMPKRLHPKDKIVCFKVSEESLDHATVYYGLIEKVAKLPSYSRSTLEDLMTSAFAVTPNHNTQLIKAFLFKQPEDSISASDIVMLLKGKIQTSTVMAIKKDLGLTQSRGKLKSPDREGETDE